MTAMTTVVRITRTIAAPPHRVYRAWLDPEQLVRWAAPRSYRAARAEVDERVGGRYRVWQTGPDGEDVGGFESELLELVPDERIVLRWSFVGPERVADPAHDSLLTVTLREIPSGTELTLVHERLEAIDAARPGMSANTHSGWTQALEALDAAVAEDEPSKA